MRLLKRGISLYALLTLTALLMGACEPVDIATFMKSEEVQEILDNIYVVLTDDSSAARRAYKSIILLDETKYYAIESDGDPVKYAAAGVYPLEEDSDPMPTISYIYLTGNPATEHINQISKGGGESGRVTGLSNGKTYKVSTAKPVTGTLAYTSSSTANPTFDANSPIRAVTDGTISLPDLDGDGDIYYLNINSIFSGTPDASNISIAEVGDSLVTPQYDLNGVMYIKLGTQTDYVFAEFTDFSKTELVKFSVLTVEMTPAATGELTINLTPYSNPGEGITKLEPTATAIFSVSDFETNNAQPLTITVELQPNVTIIGWYFGDLELDNNLNGITISNNDLTLEIKFDEIDDTLIEILGVGKHYITVYAAATDGAYWAAKIEVEVTDN